MGMKHKSTPPAANNSNLTTYSVGAMQASVHRSLQKHSDAILKPYGITKAQWLLIGTVLDYGEKGVSISELGNKLDTTLAYLTNTVNLLESKNILVRNRSSVDSREKFVTIQANFVPMCDEIEKTLREGLSVLIYGAVSPANFKQYVKVLQKLSNIDTVNNY